MSSIGKNSIVGDFSRVCKSKIGEYCRIDMQNLLQEVRLCNRSI